MRSSVSDHAAEASSADPLVSVILIFLNGEKFIEEAIDSVIAQTYSNWELLLVDDGSTGKSTEIAKQYARKYPARIRYLEHPGHINRGMSPTRNLGIKNAKGELIAFIDSDDYWKPNKLTDQVALMKAHPEVGMVCGTVVYWFSWADGTDIVIPTGHKQDAVIDPPESLFALYPLGTATPPCPSDILVRASVAKSVGGFEEHFSGSYQMYEDQGFFSKVYLAAPVYFASEGWLQYRIHEDSCVASVKRAGHYHRVRQYYLDWLRSYLRSLAPDVAVDSRVIDALRSARRWNSLPGIVITELISRSRRLRHRIGLDRRFIKKIVTKSKRVAAFF